MVPPSFCFGVESQGFRLKGSRWFLPSARKGFRRKKGGLDRLEFSLVPGKENENGVGSSAVSRALGVHNALPGPLEGARER